jgi:hypothetical protein
MPAPTGKFSKDILNKETDARFWAQTGYKPQQPLNKNDPSDRAMMATWAHIFSEVKKENDGGRLVVTYNHPQVEKHLDAAEISSHAAQGHIDASRTEPDPQKAQAHHDAANDLIHAAARAAHAAADLQPPSVSPHVAEVAAHDVARVMGALPPSTVVDKLPAHHPANTHPASTPHFDITVQYPIDPHADAWKPRRHRVHPRRPPPSARPPTLGRGKPIAMPSSAAPARFSPPSIPSPLIFQSQVPAPRFDPPPFHPSTPDFFPGMTPAMPSMPSMPSMPPHEQGTSDPRITPGTPNLHPDLQPDFHPDVHPDFPPDIHPDAAPPGMGSSVSPDISPGVGPSIDPSTPPPPPPSDVAIAQATTAHEHAVEVHERAAARAAQGAPPPTSTVSPDDLAQIRGGAKKLAETRGEPAIGVISDSNGKWSTQGFGNAASARDWYVHNTDHPDTFAYAAYFDRTSEKWPAPVEDLTGSSQAISNAARTSQEAAAGDSNDNIIIFGSLALIGALIVGSRDKAEPRESKGARR